MSRLLDTPNPSGGTTDHSVEVSALRRRAARLSDSGDHAQAVVVRAAADLLACHDDSGISLDHWTGPRDLVSLILSRHTRTGTFTPNGV